VPGISPEAKVIFNEELRRQLKRLSWRILTFLVPVMLFIAWGVTPIIRNLTEDKAPSAPLQRIGYIDNAEVILPVAAESRPKQFLTLASGTAALNNGEIEALFVIPADYVSEGEVQWYRKDGGFLSNDSLAGVFRLFLSEELIAGLVEPSVLERVVNPANFTVFEVDKNGVATEEPPDAQQAAEFFVPFIFAFLLMFAIVAGSGSLLQSVADEKENRMIEMIITSASPLSIMSGKVLALGLAGLIQVTVWLLSAALIAPRIMEQVPDAGELNISLGLLLTVLVLFVAGYFLFAIIMAGMGAATTSVREASQISAIVTVPAVIPVWFSSLIIAQPHGVFARALTFIPLTAPTTILMRLSADGIAAWEVALSVLVILLASAGLLWVSARIFRAGLLLYGQRMSLKNVWAALRAGS
jgi:ABC-2 type transport system permease protein